MTESVGAYRPDVLDPGPPPPRNVGVPESSIAGGLNGDVRLLQRAEQKKPESRWSSYSISENEAQSTKTSVSQSQPTHTATSSSSQQKSRLRRPRKAAITLTPQAVSHVQDLLDSPEPKLIRVGVKNKGCSGSAYHLEYVDKPGTFDETVEQDGVKVLIDSKALIKVIGSEMDWVEDKLSARFTFNNPNIKEQCGCGESFSIG